MIRIPHEWVLIAVVMALLLLGTWLLIEAVRLKSIQLALAGGLILVLTVFSIAAWRGVIVFV